MRGTMLGMNREWIGNGNAGVDAAAGKDFPMVVLSGRTMPQRMRSMFVQVTKSLLDPSTVRYSSEAVQGCPARDDRCEVLGVRSWIHRNMTYRGEIPGFDRFQTLQASKALGSADCDCASIAGLTLLSDKGYTAGIRIVMYDEHDGHGYNIFRSPRMAQPADQYTVPLDLSDDRLEPGDEVDRSLLVSIEDYWYDPLAWIAWMRSGMSLDHAPMPVPSTAT